MRPNGCDEFLQCRLSCVNDEEEPPGRSLSPGLLEYGGGAGVLTADEETVPLAAFRPSRRPRGSGRTGPSARHSFPTFRTPSGTTGAGRSGNRIRTLEQLERMLVLSDEERRAWTAGGAMLPVGHHALLHEPAGSGPTRPAAAADRRPDHRRVRRGPPGEADDPLGEDGHSPVPGLVHRYPDRVLFLVLDFCSTYCRYCTRSRVVGHGEIAARARPGWKRRSTTSAARRRSATCCSPAAIRWP